MPKKLPQGRAEPADCIAALLRIWRSASISGDNDLRGAAASELRTKYGIDVSKLVEAGGTAGGGQ